MRIKRNKKRSFYRDEFVCPVLLKPEVINCDRSCMFWGSKGSKDKRELGNRSKFSGRHIYIRLFLLISELVPF